MSISDNRGISALGLCHPAYPVQRLIKSFYGASQIRSGWLDKFFNGKSSDNAAALMNMSNPKLIRVHIINGPGLNNSRVQRHEITFGYDNESLVQAILRNDPAFMGKFRARCEHVATILGRASVGTLEPLISPWLEHATIPEAAFRRLAQVISEVMPHAKVVDNPVKGALFVGGDFLRERHGDNPGNVDIFDLDGLDWEECDLRQYAERGKNAKMCLNWGFKENGLHPEEKWVAPAARTHWPEGRERKTNQHFVSPTALRVLSPLNPVDIQGLERQDETDGWKKDFVWKLGEDKGYAVTLFPRSYGKQFNTVSVRKDGRLIDTARYRGRYTSDGSGRQIWDFRRHIVEYPDNCVIVANKRFGWVLEKPQFRID